MKASDVLRLRDWIQNKRTWINLEHPTQPQIGRQAAFDLDCRVSLSSLRDVMVACGLQTKRVSKHAAELAELKDQIAQQAKIIVKLVTASTVPEWLQAELMTEDLTAEVKEALAKNAPAGSSA